MSKTFGPDIGPSSPVPQFDHMTARPLGAIIVGEQTDASFASAKGQAENLSLDHGANASPKADEDQAGYGVHVTLPEDRSLPGQLTKETLAQLDSSLTDASPAAADAFGQLYMHYRQRVAAGVLRGMPPEQQEDILQIASIKAFRNIMMGGYDGRGFFSWFATITRRVSIDQHRRTTVRPQEDFFGIDREATQAQEASGDFADEVVDRVTVQSALGQLSDEHRDVVEKTTMGGLTFPQYARTIGVPEGTAKSRGHYALRQLKPILRDRE